jgi:hypothetical protein
LSVTLDVDDEPTPGLDADGRPDPAYAERLGLVPAPAGRRSAAFALDALIWVLLAVPGAIGFSLLASETAAAGGDPAAVDPDALTTPLVLVAVSLGLLVVFGIVQLALHGRKALTLGKAAFSIRSVGVARFAAPGFWHVVLRALVLWAGQLVLPFVGPAVLFASSSWDPERRRRSWLDRIGGSYAIDVRRGLNPLDPKALRHARRAFDAPVAADVVRLPSLATDRAPGEELFIPSARSSSGVVSAAPAEPGAWTPPPLSATSAPAEPERAIQRAPAQRPGFALVFDDGTRVAASARGLLGRSPAPAPGEPSAQLVPLVDDSMRISKTHAAYGVDDAGFWVADRSSKNGTLVELPDGSTRRLAPGVPTQLPPGARVALGGRSFTVTVAPGR